MAWEPWLDNDDAADDVQPAGRRRRAERKTCRDCWRPFWISPAEAQFMKARGLEPPARCQDCRAMRRKVRDANEQNAQR